MIEEIQVPPPPKFFICPCCIFSFVDKAKFITHCEKMKAQIDAAIASAKGKQG